MKYEGLQDRTRPAKTATSLLAGIRNVDTGEPEQVTTWTIAASVLMAALQRQKGTDGRPVLRLKGGAYLEWLLHPSARATQDIDTVFTEEADRFQTFLQDAVAQPLGDFSFILKARAGEIDVPVAAVNPRRHEIQVVFARKLLRKVVLEVSFSEGGLADSADEVLAPRLEPFGVPTPSHTIASISPEYQIAQKMHACTGPGHEDRERDVLDILLLKRNVFDSGRDTSDVNQACLDIFEVRALNAGKAGLQTKSWPTKIAAHHNWGAGFAHLAESLGVDIDLQAAISEINDWLSDLRS
ncbi:nucleotidyl transferase AbiEii/AbiGii toxin family protein [Paenarthrobacter sp. NPDC057981]|uniref:nucleotidyl transferase AbiEii/AbiGii toxin family protein n=1 Tax=Paenarthrobacter sp. NPDC057981 TaxID=3346297 RepID=UPI0036DB4C4C